MTSTLRRVIIATGLYVVLVIIAIIAFQWMRAGTRDVGGAKAAYALFGPALSLFTHMSYFLFAVHSVFVLPWLLLGFVYSRARWLSALAFVASWLGIGWYMHDLF
jgi:hypothetical protein